jgi:hypothetical protein
MAEDGLTLNLNFTDQGGSHAQPKPDWRERKRQVGCPVLNVTALCCLQFYRLWDRSVLAWLTIKHVKQM